MIVVDSSALVVILRREPEADNFLRIISEAGGCLLSAVTLLEVSMVLAGRGGDSSYWTELDALIARGGDRDRGARRRACSNRENRILAVRPRPPSRRPQSWRLRLLSLASYRNLPLLYKGDDFSRTDLRSAT